MKTIKLVYNRHRVTEWCTDTMYLSGTRTKFGFFGYNEFDFFNGVKLIYGRGIRVLYV